MDLVDNTNSSRTDPSLGNNRNNASVPENDYVHHAQRKYQLSSNNLLQHTAPIQAAFLLIAGPLYTKSFRSGGVVDTKTSSAVLFVVIASCLDTSCNTNELFKYCLQELELLMCFEERILGLVTCSGFDA
nr:UDP-rhamnose/UDP-galactose transporter 4-like [Tanacetum cinerariifolium]